MTGYIFITYRFHPQWHRLHIKFQLNRSINLKVTTRTNSIVHTILEVFTAVKMLVLVFGVVMPYGLVGRCFGEMCCLHIQPWRWRQYVPPKRWYLPTSPRDVTALKTSIDSTVHFTVQPNFVTETILISGKMLQEHQLLAKIRYRVVSASASNSLSIRFEPRPAFGLSWSTT
jgi:hypothetical protein